MVDTRNERSSILVGSNECGGSFVLTSFRRDFEEVVSDLRLDVDVVSDIVDWLLLVCSELTRIKLHTRTELSP